MRDHLTDTAHRAGRQRSATQKRLLALLGAPTLAPLGLFLAFLALYIRTAAPSVLAGDAAEFQLAAPLLGVPHPTTYPLYVLLGKLFTLLPFGELAWRVTLVSAASAALAVALFFALARRLLGSATGALLATLAFGLAPGLWNAATMAEVYALLMALLVGLGLLLADRRPPTADRRPPTAVTEQTTSRKPQASRMRLAALVAGLGASHHGLFVLCGLPVFAAYALWWAFAEAGVSTSTPTRGGPESGPSTRARPWPLVGLGRLAPLALFFALGTAPLLLPPIQFARFGPFDGVSFGLPDYYFWGAPTSWGALFDLLGGGDVRRDIFRLPEPGAALAALQLVGTRLLFEFGPIGVPLGLLGSAALLRRWRAAWWALAWVFLITLAYLLLLGPAVQDAPVFTLPIVLPWALWIGAGGLALAGWLATALRRDRGGQLARLALAGLLVATLGWGYTRARVSSKRHLWLFREFATATLAQLPPRAVVITHWEQGTTLRYLTVIERQRTDVWVDTIEPQDVAWAEYARRYPDRPVFFIGRPADVDGMPVDLVRADSYADLFRLRDR